MRRAGAAGRGHPASISPGYAMPMRRTSGAGAAYVARLRAEPGIVITEAEQRDGKFLIVGLARSARGRSAAGCWREAGIDPARVVSHWEPYQGLDPQFVLKRLQASLDPPPGVTLAVDGDRIVARGIGAVAAGSSARAPPAACCRQERPVSTCPPCAISTTGRSASCAMRSNRTISASTTTCRCRRRAGRNPRSAGRASSNELADLSSTCT